MTGTEEVREMRIAETVLNIIRDMELNSRNRLLESRVTRKAVKRGSGRGGWKRTEYFSTSLAAYSTSRPVPRGPGGSNAPWLPDRHFGLGNLAGLGE